MACRMCCQVGPAYCRLAYGADIEREMPNYLEERRRGFLLHFDVDKLLEKFEQVGILLHFVVDAKLTWWSFTSTSTSTSELEVEVSLMP